MSTENPTWTCETVKTDGNQELSITVGESFIATCKGDSIAFDSEKIELKIANQNDPFLIKILKIDSLTENEVKLLLTSYRVGEHKGYSVILTDSKSYVTLSPLDWSVKSVIDESKKAEIEPFPSYGPWKMSWPIWYWVILFFIILIASLMTYLKVKRWLIYKRIKEEVEQFKKNHNHFDEAQKNLRKQQRLLEKYDISGDVDLREVEKSFTNEMLLFVKRQWLIEEKSLTSKNILKKVNKYFEKDDKTKTLFKRLIKEVAEIKKQPNFKTHDLNQLIEWSQDFIEKVQEREEVVK